MSLHWISGLGCTPPAHSSTQHFVMASGGDCFAEMWGLGRVCPSCLPRMHSWRKLKLEKAATFPAIQAQLALVCLHKDSSGNNL